MARKPFFSGNYGSSLGRVDTSSIVGAGRAQGQTFQQIGSMIQQYQLNKEKRQKEEDAAVGGLMGLSPESLKQFTSRNPKVAGAVEKLISGAGGKREVDLVNAGLAPFIAGQARETDARLQEATIKGKEFENKFNEADKTNRLLRSTLETEGVELLNKFREKQNLISEIEADIKSNERDVDRDKRYLDLDKAKLELDDMRETIKTKRKNNSVFAEQLERERTKDAVDISVLMSQLAVNTEKLDQLRASKEVDQKTKEENLKILKAERKQLEQDLTNKQNLMSSFSSNVNQVDKNDPMYKQFASMDLSDAFQGDIPGLFFNAVGNLGGFFGAELTPETATEGQKIESLNALLKPALVAQLSSRPSNYTLETIKKFMPQRGDSNQVGKTKLRQLIPILENRSKEATSTVTSGKPGTSYYQDAKEQAVLLPKIIQGLEAALRGGDPNVSTGKTSNNVGYRIVK